MDSTELLRAALDHVNHGVVIVRTRTLEYAHVNSMAARMFDLDRDEMMRLGPRLSCRWESDAEVRLRALYDRLIAGHPAGERVEETVVRVDGSTFIAEFQRQMFRWQDEWFAVVTLRDVSELAEARSREERFKTELAARMDELARSNQELQQFAYITSHDLSEPLRMVSSYTQLLSKRYSQHIDADGREFMEFIVDGAQRMKRLIDDLLTYSRAGRPGAQMKAVELDSALDDALANLQQRIADVGATIERDPMPRLVAERVGMVQLFQNLVGNALKFRGERDPVIRIEVRDEPGHWSFAVRDNGIGIAPEHFERIFVVFQRLHARNKYEGTGIGLAICKKIVERHGGRIWVESRPGEGTAFLFTLSKENNP